MDTPIYDFVQEYIRRDVSRLHMPGHKGKPALGCEAMDITEIEGADSLYQADGIIARSERNAAKLFGAQRTFYAAGGSSQCVKAMLYLALTGAGGQRGAPPVVAAARNVHGSFIHASALLDIDVEWMYPPAQSSVCSCLVTPPELESRLDSMEAPPFAVYVTSPDYLGFRQDIAGLAEVCRKRGLPLLVDNAHGAYLKFLGEPAHPMDLGASMCCDSAHKTLPVLTGGAYLHIGKDAPQSYAEGARGALALFGSSSPSYLVLESLDLCNRYLADGYRGRLARCIGHVSSLRASLEEFGYTLAGTEPLKITIDAARSRGGGERLAGLLREHLVECEYADMRYVVLMFTPENRDEDFRRIEKALRLPVSKAAEPPRAAGIPSPARKVLSIRRALMSERETVPAALSEGRVCSSPVLSCPPEVPLCVSGERITRATVELFECYGIDSVGVVRE